MFSDFKYKKKGMLSGNFLIVLVMLFVLSIIFIVGYKAFTDINTDLQLDSDLSNESKAISADLHNRYPSTFDGAFAVFLVLSWLFVIVAGFYVDTHPILFAVMILILVAILFLAAIFANSYDEVVAEDEFSGLEDNFPILNFTVSNLLIVALVMGISIIVSLFIKSRY